LSSRSQKIVFLVIGIITIAMGVLLVGTAGIKGFNGAGGSDTPLFQLLTYMMIPDFIGGLLAVVAAFRPSRLIALISGVLLVIPGLFMTLLNPIYGGPIIVLGVVALVMRRKIPKN
jgi:hypothetical protein